MKYYYTVTCLNPRCKYNGVPIWEFSAWLPKLRDVRDILNLGKHPEGIALVVKK